MGFSGAVAPPSVNLKSEICNLKSCISRSRRGRTPLRYRTFVKPVAAAIAILATFSCALLRGEEPAAPKAVTVPPMEFKHFTLPNGLQVYTVEDHDTPIVAVQVWYHVGSKDD